MNKSNIIQCSINLILGVLVFVLRFFLPLSVVIVLGTLWVVYLVYSIYTMMSYNTV